MSDFWSEELITDYLDDRLSKPDREQVEAHLTSNPGDAEMMREFQQLRLALRGTPKFKLDSEFSNRVIQQISMEAMANSAVEPSARESEIGTRKQTTPGVSAKRPSANPVAKNSTNWRSIAVWTTASAATILLAVFLIPRSFAPVDLAKATEADKKTSRSGAVVDDESAANVSPGDAGSSTNSESASEETSPADSMSSPESESTKKDSRVAGNDDQSGSSKMKPKSGTEASENPTGSKSFRLREEKSDDSELRQQKRAMRDDPRANEGTGANEPSNPAPSKPAQANQRSKSGQSPNTDSLVDSDAAQAGDESNDVEKVDFDYQPEDVFVVNVQPTGRNMDVIRGFNRGESWHAGPESTSPSEVAEEPPGRGSPTLPKMIRPGKEIGVDGSRDSGAQGGQKVNESRQKKDQSPGLNPKMSKDSVDDSVNDSVDDRVEDSVAESNEGLSSGMGQLKSLEDALVFEVTATPDEFRMVLEQIEGQTVDLTEPGQQVLVERFKELRFGQPRETSSMIVDRKEPKEKQESSPTESESGFGVGGTGGELNTHSALPTNDSPDSALSGLTIKRLTPGSFALDEKDKGGVSLENKNTGTENREGRSREIGLAKRNKQSIDRARERRPEEQSAQTDDANRLEAKTNALHAPAKRRKYLLVIKVGSTEPGPDEERQSRQTVPPAPRGDPDSDK